MWLLSNLIIYIIVFCHGINTQFIPPAPAGYLQSIQLQPVQPGVQAPTNGLPAQKSAEWLLGPKNGKSKDVLRTVAIANLLDKNRSSKRDSLLDLAVLKRLKRSPYSSSSQEDEVYLLDFLIDNYLHQVIRGLDRQEIIQKNSTTTKMVRAVVNEHVIESQFYLVLTKQIEDDIGACRTLNNPKWWIRGFNVPGIKKKVILIDVLLETFLRYVFKWLCEHHYISTDYTPNELGAHGLAFTKTLHVYNIIVHNATDSLGVWKTLSVIDWWLQGGLVNTKGKVLKWTPLKHNYY